MEKFTKEDLEVIEAYKGDDASDKAKHKRLKEVYDKLGYLCDLIGERGYYTDIRKDPRKQAGPGRFVFQEYQWGKVLPSDLANDCKDDLAYIVGVNGDSLHFHLMGIKENHENPVSLDARGHCWTEIDFEGLSYEEIADKFIEHDKKYRDYFIETAAKLGIKKFQKMSNSYRMNEFKSILEYKNQIILQGPPGTGKTYTAKDIAEQLLFDKGISLDKDEQMMKLVGSRRFKLVQFHPAYSYEDFVRGIVTKSENGQIHYETRDQTLAEMALAAKNDPDKAYVLIIDEINRANLPAVLGELIYELEYRGQAVESMYQVEDSRKLVLPENLYIIGTMNTADRSVGHIDYAIRRRFAFVDMLPDPAVLDSAIENSKVKSEARRLFEEVEKLFTENVLAPDFRKEDVQVGHSYFIAQELAELHMKMRYEVVPLLMEYVKDGILLSTATVDGEPLVEFINNLTNEPATT